MRAVLIAVLVVLACTLSVSASSADWSAPEALWSSDLSASELEARHSEFLMATDGSSSSSSTGPNLAASSTAFNFVPIPLVPPPEPIVVLLAIDTSACTENSTDPTCFFTPAGAAKLEAAVTASFGFPDTFNFPGEQFIATFATVAASSSTGPTGRRLLQAGGTAATFDFVGSPKDGGVHARKIYAAFSESLACTDATCQDNLQKKYDLPSSPAAASVFTVAAASVVAGSLKVDEAAVKAGSDDALGVDATERNVNTVGGPRNTNIGYYVLGAVLLAFIVAALVYFIVHKKPVQAVVKEEPLRRDEVVAAPVVAAPVAHNSGVVVAEEQPLAAGQQQMDYRSVFALKHNVLDKSAEQKAAEEDEHNHNDVHFILHQ